MQFFQEYGLWTLFSLLGIHTAPNDRHTMSDIQ